MRARFRILAVVAAVAVPSGAMAADPSPSCQQAVARAAAKFTKAALKIGQRCAMRTGLGAGCMPARGSEGAAGAAVGRAAGRLAARVGDDCAGADLSAFARRCPDASGPPFTAAELVQCLRDTHLDRVAGMLAVEFPAAAARTAGTGGECTAPETCQCRCASPSGAFVGTGSADVF
jgi:hypothetical protein